MFMKEFRKETAMSRKKTYFLLSGIIFTLVAIAHLVRILTQTPILLGSLPVPMLCSWMGLVIAAFLSLCAFELLTKEPD